MKISVSLPEADVTFLDEQSGNRSALLHQAIQLLRRERLAEQYTSAFDEAEQEQALWDAATADGLPA